MDKDVGDEELVPLDEDMPEDLQELSPRVQSVSLQSLNNSQV